MLFKCSKPGQWFAQTKAKAKSFRFTAPRDELTTSKSANVASGAAPVAVYAAACGGHASGRREEARMPNQVRRRRRPLPVRHRHEHRRGAVVEETRLLIFTGT